MCLYVAVMFCDHWTYDDVDISKKIDFQTLMIMINIELLSRKKSPSQMRWFRRRMGTAVKLNASYIKV